MHAELAPLTFCSLLGVLAQGMMGHAEWIDRKGPAVGAALDSLLLRLYPEEEMATDTGQGSLTKSHIWQLEDLSLSLSLKNAVRSAHCQKALTAQLLLDGLIF